MKPHSRNPGGDSTTDNADNTDGASRRASAEGYPGLGAAFLLLDPVGRAARVKEWAWETGFDLVGIARAEALEKEGAFLRRWIAEGRHAGMAWMANAPERRADPREVLEGCRSVIVVGCNYHREAVEGGNGTDRTDRTDGSEGPNGASESDGIGCSHASQISQNSHHSQASHHSRTSHASHFPDPAPDARLGRVAQYAQRVDYHRTMGKALRTLARRLVGESGGAVVAREYVDTGPILEKAWAQRAGLGFVGKNTCLIHRKRGSWFLLGVILTTLELEPDPAAAPDGCGACRRCLDACPTGALIAPGVLDAGRCLSYLTIEHRGETVPEESGARGKFEGWVFGCDICQEVCPYNGKFAIESPETGILGPYLHPSAISLEAILSLDPDDEEAFLEWVGRRSPLRRAGVRGLQRNAREQG